jgi:putative tryptophan/tyrosine transport system substrate-binding protein
MRRREFIAALGCAAAMPRTAGAQAMPVIGFLSSERPAVMGTRLAAYHRGLSEGGYTENGNVRIEYRWAEGHRERIISLVDELVRQKVAIIVANAPSVGPAKAATRTIPIVFFTGLDPVAAGLVTSLSRPGANLTGVGILNTELVPKRVELLRELLPAAKRAGVVLNTENPNAEAVKRGADGAARSLGLEPRFFDARFERDLDAAFLAAAEVRVDGLVIAPDPVFTNFDARIAELAARHKLPTISQFREFAAAGGLMSYSGSIVEAYRQMGIYTGRILRGEKVGDLPVQQLTKVELIVNLKTAKALNLTVPQSLLARADEVIE